MPAAANWRHMIKLSSLSLNGGIHRLPLRSPPLANDVTAIALAAHQDLAYDQGCGKDSSWGPGQYEGLLAMHTNFFQLSGPL